MARFPSFHQPSTLKQSTKYHIDPQPAIQFPDPRHATSEGLVAIGGDLSVPRLLEAYRRGIFPWTIDPISWWSPDPRAIFELHQFHIPKTLAKTIRQKTFQITTNQAFRDVMLQCAADAPGRQETWITPPFIEAYTRLHEQGHAHSLECWRDGQLVGGIYGVAIGGLFAGESMFHRQSNASKVALYHLMQHLRDRRYTLFDIQTLTPITRQLGAVTISRQEYLHRLAQALPHPCKF